MIIADENVQWMPTDNETFHDRYDTTQTTKTALIAYLTLRVLTLLVHDPEHCRLYSPQSGRVEEITATMAAPKTDQISKTVEI